MSSEAPAQKGRVRQVGMVHANLTVANAIDLADTQRGLLPPDRARSVTLEEVLVDTGATTLCLPADIVRQLGLRLLTEVPARTATGRSILRVFQDAHITVQDRRGTFECVELPEGSQPLLGVVPLELLGLEPDLRNQVLRPLPEPYIFVL
jgi:clan AA aspartic protease